MIVPRKVVHLRIPGMRHAPRADELRRLALEVLGIDGDGTRLAAHMRHDKKMDAGTLPFVLLRGIGEAFLDKAVSLEDVAEFLDEELQAH